MQSRFIKFISLLLLVQQCSAGIKISSAKERNRSDNALGDKCVNSIECSKVAFSTCSPSKFTTGDGRCRCRSGFKDVGGACISREHSDCPHGVPLSSATCQLDHVMLLSRDPPATGSTIPSATLRSTASMVSTEVPRKNWCPYETHFCQQKLCCPKPCRRGLVFKNMQCYPRVYLGGACQVNEQCEIHEGECIKGVCNCGINFVKTPFNFCARNRIMTK